MAEHAPTVDRIAERSFLVIAYDGEDSETPRDTELEGHLEFIEKNYDRYLACGPMHSDDGTHLIGSYFLVLADSAKAARAFLDGDPYIQSGMYDRITVHEVTQAGGRWMGGVIWESAEQIRANAS